MVKQWSKAKGLILNHLINQCSQMSPDDHKCTFKVRASTNVRVNKWLTTLVWGLVSIITRFLTYDTVIYSTGSECHIRLTCSAQCTPIVYMYNCICMAPSHRTPNRTVQYYSIKQSNRTVQQDSPQGQSNSQGSEDSPASHSCLMNDLPRHLDNRTSCKGHRGHSVLHAMDSTCLLTRHEWP